jgi:hypothetical protein
VEVLGKAEERGAKSQSGSAKLKRPSRNKHRVDTGRQNTKEGTMSNTVAERTAEHIAESAHQASRATSAVADAIRDGVGAVRRAAKEGGDAAEEFLDDTTQRLQRHVVLTVVTTFAVGFTTGALIGWMMKRR